jgi:hypothetical protein
LIDLVELKDLYGKQLENEANKNLTAQNAVTIKNSFVDDHYQDYDISKRSFYNYIRVREAIRDNVFEKETVEMFKKGEVKYSHLLKRLENITKPLSNIDNTTEMIVSVSNNTSNRNCEKVRREKASFQLDIRNKSKIGLETENNEKLLNNKTEKAAKQKTKTPIIENTPQSKNN